jgi:hypothetical protein
LLSKTRQLNGSGLASFIETAAAEKTFVGCVLFYVGGVSLLSRIGMMFVLHQFIA